MIPVVFDPSSPAQVPPADQPFWQQWLQTAGDATDDAIDAFETWLAGNRAKPFDCPFKEAIWKDLKDWLRENTFFRRCAYCERLISGFTGDAEHYRPKGAVQITQPGGKPVRVMTSFDHPDTGQSITIPHPGYFWLAYDWRNLIPACKFCNSGRGKNALFDTVNQHRLFTTVAAGSRASRRWPGLFYPSPVLLDAEEGPLFLNPLNPCAGRNPRDHIRFKEFGIGFAVNHSEIGNRTMSVFRLTTDDIVRDRQQAQEQFQQNFLVKMLGFRPGAPNPGDLLVEEYKAGRHPFSAAALDYHQILRAAM